MKTLVVAATQKELKLINVTKPHHEKYALAVGAFYFGQKLEELLQAHQGGIDLIILVGIAGCAKEHSLGTHVVVTNDAFGDLGALTEQSFETLEDMGFREKDKKETNDFNIEKRFIQSVTKAKSITVNSIYDNDPLNQLRLKKHNATLENMEGAAFHYICQKHKVPYLHIRGLSNYIGERDKSQWKIAEAVNSYSTFLNEKLAQWS